MAGNNTSLSSCAASCEKYGLRAMTRQDMQDACDSGFPFSWWGWVDDGACVYQCNRVETPCPSGSNTTCYCFAN